MNGQLHASAALPPGKTRYPLYRMQDRCGRVRKIFPPPPGFDPQTIQPVASRYTDWAIAAHLDTVNFVKDGHPYEHIPSFVHPHYGDVLFLVLPVVALLQMHDGTIPVATCSEEDLAVCLFTAGSFNQLHWMK